MESKLEIDKFCNNNTLETLRRAPEYLREMYIDLCQDSSVVQANSTIRIEDICFIPDEIELCCKLEQINQSVTEEPWIWYWFIFSMAVLFVVTGSLALAK